MFFINYLYSKIGKLCTSSQEQIFPEMKYHFKGRLFIPFQKTGFRGAYRPRVDRIFVTMIS